IFGDLLCYGDVLHVVVVPSGIAFAYLYNLWKMAQSGATSCYIPPEVAGRMGVRVKCIMKRIRTRLDVGRKDDKEEAATEVFDTMIRNMSPKVGEELQEENGTSDADEPPGSSSQPAGWGFVPTGMLLDFAFKLSVLIVLGRGS
ncbi:hypothetical protein Tco_0606530, partial [Tanacetum coccineum]